MCGILGTLESSLTALESSWMDVGPGNVGKLLAITGSSVQDVKDLKCLETPA